MIAFDFDRAKMRRRLITYSAILLAGILVLALSCAWTLSHIGRGWVGWLVLVLLYVIQLPIIDSARWVGALIRGLRRNSAAFIINQDGIVDNASDVAPGQLAWDEIEKMYPSDWKTRLLVDRWERMPILSKQRGIVVILKDGIDFQHLLRSKPKIIQLLSKQWYVAGHGRWLFIPEMVLAVTADDLMPRLNNFYTTQVRGY